jgi:hypothetical protein
VSKQQAESKKTDKNENDDDNKNIDFPSVPSDNIPDKKGAGNSSESYDDLAARFANLKKK